MERKEIINKVLNNASTKVEAIDVVDWFADSVEGQNYLSESIDRDFYLMEESDEQDNLISPIQSAKILSDINKAIYRKRFNNNLFKAAAILIPLYLLLVRVYTLTRWFVWHITMLKYMCQRERQ